ncbi:MAG: hypothetical protein ABS949_10545 [Solibacillus sp.]
MEKQKKSLMILVFVNILVACFVQIICSSIFTEKMDMTLFQFVIFPLILVCINVAMALKFNLKFYHYSVSAYLGFLCSIIAFAFILLILERPQELPPGEIVLGADLILVILISFIQFVALLFLNLVVYIIFKLFFAKRLLRKNRFS